MNLQGIGFDINTKNKNGEIQLTVLPYGLSESNNVFNTSIKREVTNSEIEDLNSDGFPEVLVYTETPDHFGNLIGYSVNNGKSISRVSFPDISSDEEISENYNGFDEFTIIENYMGRKFPLFENGKKPGSSGK